MKKRLAIILFFLPQFLCAQTNEIPALTWPQEFEKENMTVVIYQPQLESFKNNTLEGRMAVSIKPKDKELIFGAMWFKAKMETDKEERIVVLKSIDITQTRFPDVDEDKVQLFADELEKDIEGKNIMMSLDHLLASLEAIEDQKALSEKINNDPPKIFYRKTAAVLIYIDGEPKLEKTSDDNVKYVVNSPYFIVQDQITKNYYLKGGKFWYSSTSVSRDWKSISAAPKNIEKVAKEAFKNNEEQVDSAMLAMKDPPEIIVSTEPAELIITDGEPDFKSINSTSLLFLSNSESDILMDINTQKYYILLAGRWFTSKSLENGPWMFVEPDELPEDFSKIPSDGDMNNVRVSVPGTEEANEALLEQSIPQTATVDRNTATVEVKYDGNPKFENIPDTKVSYAVNADKTVLLINNRYYCVDDAIWFESDNPAGEWQVSVKRPDEVDDIPPESPVYNTKYVYIYDYTPSVVYVGYTPGYTCSYIYNGVVVYGTGYYYHPWYYSYYYPRPVTYGFSVHYNPWTGWGFSYGMSFGWFSVGFHSPYYNWWGPAGYHYGYRHGYYHGYHHGYHHGYNQGYYRGYYEGRKDGYNPGRPTTYQNNLYKDRTGNKGGVTNTGVRPGTRESINTRDSKPATQRPTSRESQPTAKQKPGRESLPGSSYTRPSTQPNNVYTDRNGNVYQRDQGGNWQQRSQGSWNNQTSTQQGNQNLNSAYNQRQQGSQNYNKYSQTRNASRPSGNYSRGGGGRRR